MKALFILGWMISILAAGCGGAMRSGTPRTNEFRGAEVEVWVSSSGRALPIFYLDGLNYLLGEEGDRYAICMKSQIDTRIEAVVSVDGRDVVSGRIADYKQDRGYVLMPGEEICVEGFRRSLTEVAAFEFTRPTDSYAARMGDAGNVGVIGVAVFSEMSAPQPAAVIASEASPPPAQSSEPALQTQDALLKRSQSDEAGLGTGYSGSVESDAEMVPFFRSDTERPLELIVLYYDNREGLERKGIVFDDGVDRPLKPNPFPGINDTESGFAPSPPR